MIFASTALAIAVAIQVPGFEARLPNDSITAPRVGISCDGSTEALGTGNAVGNGWATSVVNIWSIVDTRNHSTIGWIVKSADGRFWYEDILGFIREITSSSADTFFRPNLKLRSCFSKDLDLPRF